MPRMPRRIGKKGEIMSHCSEMKVGDIYRCEACGLELEVKTACSCREDECGCSAMECCGEPMSKV